ncbi:MAG: rRNA pseudouridine synthase [Clostridia bacterium]|nr:rRNA pseudouridine synthase [Clostridia bacterium]
MAVIRLQKFLSERGIASRRKAEELIEAGKVKVNGRPVKLGDKVDPYKDVVTVGGKRVGSAESPTYILLNKPRGYITTMSDEQGRKCVADLLKDVGARVFPVGRLDRESEGLLLCTNDGDFANAMMHPSAHVPKNYRVTLRSEITDEQLNRFHDGVMLDGRKTAPADIFVISEEPGRTVVEIVLYEGRNRQIRRMCEMMGLEVIRLRRVAMGGVKLGMLPAGKWRHLDPKEVKALLMAAQVQNRIAASYIKHGREGQANADHRSGR